MNLSRYWSRVWSFFSLIFGALTQAVVNFYRSRDVSSVSNPLMQFNDIPEPDSTTHKVLENKKFENLLSLIANLDSAQLESEPDQIKALLLETKQNDNALIELNTLFESIPLETEPDEYKAFLLIKEQYHKSIIELQTRISSLKSENCDENAEAGWDEISDVNTKQLIRESGKSCETRIKNKDA